MLSILWTLAALAAAPRGGAENVLLVIDPTDPDSVQVGLHYAQQRQIPGRQILYLDPAVGPYDTFADVVVPAVLGTLQTRALSDRIDTIVVAPIDSYRIGDSGHLTDGCVNPSNMSISAAMHTVHVSDLLQAGTSATTSHGYASSAGPVAMDGSESWWFGSVSDQSFARQYRIGAQLGYTGDRGNTVEELLELVDRSVAADGTRPAGTFHFRETGDSARSGPRDGTYAGVAAEIVALGGQAIDDCCASLPTGVYDVAGLMTGAASLGIQSADFAFVPGAFADHLTSFAGHFGTASQTKMSEWIRKGASGSWGAVEEPCNYSAKFPRAHMHRDYFQGMNLGEATARSLFGLPLQGMLLGDPMTRPWADLPVAELIDLPPGVLRGVVRPVVMGSAPTAIDGVQLFVDGEPVWKTRSGERARLDTTALADGWHELRVVAWDDSSLHVSGRYVEWVEVDNGPQEASLALSGGGDWSTSITATLTTSGATATRAELSAGGRVVATTSTPDQPLELHGRDLGAGEVPVVATVWFDDGSRFRTEPTSVPILAEGLPAGGAPVVWDHEVRVSPDHATVIELPTSTDDAWGTTTWEVLSPPTQGVFLDVDAVPYRTYQPLPGSTGTDSFTVRATGPAGVSNTATITVVLDPCVGVGPHVVPLTPPVPGQVTTFEARCATPGELVYGGVSTSLRSPLLLPAFGVEIDLAGAVLLGAPRVADAAGRASWDVAVPPSASGTVWLQAVQRGRTSEPRSVEL